MCAGYKLIAYCIIIWTLSLTNATRTTAAISILRNRCHDFQDFRQENRYNSRESNSTMMEIPVHLLRGKDEDVNPFYFELTNDWVQCGGNWVTEIKVDLKWNVRNSLEDSFPKRHFYNSSAAIKPYPIHFTRNGYFFNGQYLSPKGDYCIASISDQKLEIRQCIDKCSQKSSSTNSLCFPKCCALDEALSYWERKCIKVAETEPLWKPNLNFSSSNLSEDKIQIKFYDAKFPAACNYSPDGNQSVGFKWHSSSPKRSNYVSPDLIEFTVEESGTIKPRVYLHSEESWVSENNGTFCADAFIVPPDENSVTTPSDVDNSRISPDQVMLIYCLAQPQPQGNKTSAKKAVSKWKAWVYTSLSLCTLPFRLATVIVYLLVLDKLNLHGLAILSFSISELLSYTLLIAAHFTFLLPNSVGSWLRIGGWLCYFNAISSHFFLLSSFMWLTTMNFGLWMTLKTMQMMRKSVGQLKQFATISAIAWGIPFLLVVGFVILDGVIGGGGSASAPTFPVPLYGKRNCFVSATVRGSYVHLPIGIFMAVNVVIISLIMKIFWDTKRQGKSLGASSASKYSPGLFLRLFLVMGGATVIDYLSWFYSPPRDKPMWVVIIECFTYLTPVLQFALFCFNERTRAQIQEKFPRIQGCGGRLRKLLGRKNEDPSVDTSETDANNKYQ